jgi:hypothetical protein
MWCDQPTYVSNDRGDRLSGYCPDCGKGWIGFRGDHALKVKTGLPPERLMAAVFA